MASGPLSITLSTSQIKTAIPQIADNSWVNLKLNAVKEGDIPNKGKTIEFEFQLAERATSADGTPIEPNGLGSKVFHTLFLFGKDGPEAAMTRAAVDAGKVIDGLLGTGDPSNNKGKPVRPDFGPQVIPDLVGKNVFALTKLDPQYGVKIKEFRFPGDVTR